AALASGDPTSALAVADEAAELAPLRESAHRLRMAAHAAAGNRAEALAVYQQLRRRLVDHFGVDPSAETEAAYLALLGAVPSGPPERPAVVDGDEPVASSLAGATFPFVGRTQELGVLADAWKDACAGDAPVVLVTGEPGIGKSRLAVEAARRITDDGRVLFGRCDEQGLVPYQPFVEALDAHVAATPSDEMPALDERALAELASVLPSLSRSRRPRTRRSRGALFEAIVALIGSVAAERPLLLVLDDLHWADPDTLLLLRHLVRRSDDMQLLLLLASRDPSPVLGGLGEVVGNLDRAGLLHRLPLPGLDEAEVRALVRSLFGRAAADPGTLRSLLAETGGNPFLLGELLRAGTAAPADHGPAPRELDGMPDAWSPAATTGTSGQLAGPSS